MRLTVVGCSGTIPGPDSPASCYLVESDGFRLVLDLGNGALGALQRFIGIDEVDAIALSHLHADHCIDLTALYVARMYGDYAPGPRLPIYGPSNTADRIAEAYGLSRSPGLHSTFAFTDLTSITQIGPFRVRSTRVQHPVEAYAVRLDADQSSLVYSGDTGPCQQLVDLAEGADVLLAEASCTTGQALPPDLHMTGKQAGEAALAAGVGHLVVTHVPPWSDSGRTLAEAQAAFGGTTTLAATGWSVSVSR